MKKLKLLVLTDHTNHSIENSLYSFVKIVRKHKLCERVDVVSRGNIANHEFFSNHKVCLLKGSRVDDSFDFYPDGRCFFSDLQELLINDYDAVWLRLPPPLSNSFLSFLEKEFPEQLFINAPYGIKTAGSKEFLLKFKSLCPPIQKCVCIYDIERFKRRFPIVLKPFKAYGGQGIIKIDGDTVTDGELTYSFRKFIENHQDKKVEYLAVQYLENVDQGDKRIIVVGGKIMGASLRLPAKDSWICNVAMGGTAMHTEVDEADAHIVAEINPVLSEIGIFMYGIDTLVGNDGLRVLSEINVTSIGGLPQIARFLNKPLLEEASSLILQYILKQKNMALQEVS